MAGACPRYRLATRLGHGVRVGTVMNIWRQHRRASRIATVMLWAWLFALVSGWANACLVQDRGQAHGVVHATAERPLIAEAASGHAQGHAGHEEPAVHGSGGARPLCQSVCDDGQTTLPTLAATSVLDLGLPSLVLSEVWSFCATQAQLLSGCPLAAPPPPEASVAIRFQRWTI